MATITPDDIAHRFNQLAYGIRECPAGTGERWSVCNVCGCEDDPHDPRCPVGLTEGRAPVTPDVAAIEARAAAAVDAIIADGSDRRGVLTLDGIDDDIRAEIVATWRAAVAREITAALADSDARVASAVVAERERCMAVCRARAEKRRKEADDEEAAAEYGEALESRCLAREDDAIAAAIATP